MEQVSAMSALEAPSTAPQEEPIASPTLPAGNPTEEPQRTQIGQPVNPEDKKVQDRIDNYVVVLMNELHGSETRDAVLDILKNGKDPYIGIPEAAMAVNDAAVAKFEQNGVNVDLNTQFNASVYLVNDLMELGSKFGFFEVTQDDFAPLLEDSLQTYVERGLKDGTIDPIELQLTAEKFTSENQRIAGLYHGQENGVPPAPQQQQIIHQIQQNAAREATEKERKKQAISAGQQQKLQQQQLMAQAQQQQQGGM